MPDLTTPNLREALDHLAVAVKHQNGDDILTWQQVAHDEAQAIMGMGCERPIACACGEPCITGGRCNG